MSKYKKTIDWQFNGVPMKIILKRDRLGKINQIMMKPDFKKWTNPTSIIGSHQFRDKPYQNHYDSFLGKDKQIIRNSSLPFPWTFIPGGIRFNLKEVFQYIRIQKKIKPVREK